MGSSSEQKTDMACDEKTGKQDTNAGYTVATLSDLDGVQPIKLAAFLQPLGRPVGALSVLLQLRFITFLWSAICETTHAGSVVGPACYLGLQLSLFGASVVEDGWRFLCGKPQGRPRLRLVGNKVPTVDVVVTTCGEDVDVILDTVRAACALDYPSEMLRVLVSDDGSSDILRTAVQELSAKTAVKLLYYARSGEAGVKRGFKAGNMNAALAHLDSFSGSAPFAAFLDADMIVEQDFLRATMAHMVANGRVGLVVVPQRFYNVPLNDPLYQSMNVQGKYDEVQRDSIDCTWNTGPGAVFRRSAVKDVGGYPEYALNEDIMMGFLLNGRGWKLVYCHEELQWGLVPETLMGHVAQRIKWSVGTLRNSRFARFGFSQTRLGQMNWKQRLIAFCHCAPPYASTINRVVCGWLLLALVATGQPLIATENASQMRALLRVFGWSVLASRLDEMLASTSSGFLGFRRRKEGLWWLSPYLFFAILQECLPKRLGGTRIGFIPTAVADSSIQERNHRLRLSLAKRLRVMLCYQGLWYHVAIMAIAAPIWYWSISWSVANASPAQSVWLLLLTHALAPGIESTMVENYFEWFVPLAYAIWPPTMPPRVELMEKQTAHSSGHGDGAFEIWRPMQQQKLEHWDFRALVAELPHIVGFVFWCLVCFSDIVPLSS